MKWWVTDHEFMAWMQWWLEFLHLIASVMRYELFNPEHWPKLYYSHWNIFLINDIWKRMSPYLQVWTPSPRWWKTRRPSWSSSLTTLIPLKYVTFVNWLTLEKRHLAMMFEFLHLKSLCRSKQTSFLTLSKDREAQVSSISLFLRNINCASALPACHFPASSVS